MSKNWWAKLTEEEKEAIRRKKSEQYWKMREERGYWYKPKQETLCWSCQRSVKECEWSANFEPVEGWDAEATKIAGPYGVIDSFLVKRCPLYEPDPPRPKKEKGAKRDGKKG